MYIYIVCKHTRTHTLTHIYIYKHVHIYMSNLKKAHTHSHSHSPLHLNLKTCFCLSVQGRPDTGGVQPEDHLHVLQQAAVSSQGLVHRPELPQSQEPVGHCCSVSPPQTIAVCFLFLFFSSAPIPSLLLSFLPGSSVSPPASTVL